MLTTLPNFLIYFSSSMIMLSAALYVYKRITPYDEIGLIRAGNVAAAVSYLGTALGMVIAMGSVIVHSTGWVDKVVWCSIGLLVQLGIWTLVNAMLGNLQKKIADDQCMASATVLGGASTAVGILQAACLVY